MQALCLPDCSELMRQTQVPRPDRRNFRYKPCRPKGMVLAASVEQANWAANQSSWLKNQVNQPWGVSILLGLIVDKSLCKRSANPTIALMTPQIMIGKVGTNSIPFLEVLSPTFVEDRLSFPIPILVGFHNEDVALKLGQTCRSYLIRFKPLSFRISTSIPVTTDTKLTNYEWEFRGLESGGGRKWDPMRSSSMLPSVDARKASNGRPPLDCYKRCSNSS